MLSTNAGQCMTNQKATVTKVWFNKNGIANTFSLASIIKNHRVMFDSNKKAAFFVHTTERIIKLILSPEGLFYHAPNYCTATQSTQSLAENESFYSHQQREQAVRALNSFTHWHAQL